MSPGFPLSTVPRLGTGYPSPAYRDAISRAIGPDLEQLFYKNDQLGFIKAVPPGDSATLLWAEAEYVQAHPLSRGVILPTVPSIAHPFDSGETKTLGGFDMVWLFRRGDKYLDVAHFTGLPSDGVKYLLCGHVFPGETTSCLEVSKHALNPDTRGKIFSKVRGCQCGRLECPECYHRVLIKVAGRVERQFKRMAGKDKAAEASTKWGKPKHFMISPCSDDDYLFQTRGGLKQIETKMVKTVKSLGVVGFAYILHMWRQNKASKKKYKPNKGIKMSYQESKECAERHGFSRDGSWYFSPHWHLIGYQPDKCPEKVKDNYDTTGYIFKQISTCDSVFGTAYYQLSHASIDKEGQGHTVKWAGIMSTRNIGRHVALDKVPVERDKCPECDSELKKYVYNGPSDTSPIPAEPGDYWLELTPDQIKNMVQVRQLHRDHEVNLDSTLADHLYSMYQLENGDWVPAEKFVLGTVFNE